MQQSVENCLSEEDVQLIEANQLGPFQQVYRGKPGEIGFLRWTSRFCVIMGIVGLVVDVIVSGWWLQRFPQQEVVDTLIQVEFLLISFGGSVLTLWAGLFPLRTAAQDAQSLHIVICEQGLLQISSEKGTRRVDALRWQDIQTIIRLFPGRTHFLFPREKGRHLTLSSSYQDQAELVALIKQRSKRTPPKRSRLSKG